MKIKFTYLLISGLIALLSTPISIKNVAANDNFKLLTTETEFEAGISIILKFSNSGNSKPNLYLSYGYGSSIIKPTTESDILKYQLPEFVSKKKGIITWTLLSELSNLSGELKIHPKQEVTTMETYLGPPSIEAGGTDYSMLVVIPTDVYDNPLKDSTAVTTKHQFLQNETETTIYMKNSISYKNIFSETKKGRILVSSTSINRNSKEFTINVLPAIPTNFEISYQQNHDYADGNQITSFSTSIIKDQHNNIVSDGTFVEFFITNTSNTILKTSGTTIKGIASAKMIHPDHKDHWTIKAFIEGMAESNLIELAFKPVILDFEVHFSKNNRTISVGPLKSFMDQMIPDGLEVALSIYKNDIKLETLSKSSFEGYAAFKLNTNNVPSNTYTIKIKTAGLEKTYSNKKL
ncbi:hypothetical protein GCM10023311_04190 [Flaviramulus aquimarinus]|uniref:Oxygen tolerance n=1 Tax=Flaviramulus aquimarinus TaxID=1170456 RepID=A0ABP9EZV6_9FLAO